MWQALAGFFGRAAASEVAEAGIANTVIAGAKAKAAHVPSTADRWNSRIWAVNGAIDSMHRLWGGVSDKFPSFMHVISVSVIGGPEADLRRVWYLCVSAAFGRYLRRAPGVQSVSMEATWDVTGKACSVSISYVNSGLVDGVARGLGGDNTSGLDLLQRGPDQLTVGGGWPIFTQGIGQQLGNVIPGAGIVGGGLTILLPGLLVAHAVADLFNNDAKKVAQVARPVDGEDDTGYAWVVLQECGTNQPVNYAPFVAWENRPIDVFKEYPIISGNTRLLPWHRILPRFGGMSQTASSFSGQSATGTIPILPDDGRVITTGEKWSPEFQGPRPPVDGLTRGSLVTLVASALSSPCFLPCAPPCGLTRLGQNAPNKVWRPGTGFSVTAFNAGTLETLVAASADALGVAPGRRTTFLSDYFNIEKVGSLDGYNTPRPENNEANIRVVCP